MKIQFSSEAWLKLFIIISISHGKPFCNVGNDLTDSSMPKFKLSVLDRNIN